MYPGKWEVKSTRDFDTEEIAIIEQAVVIASSYGNSVKFTLKIGKVTFIPLDISSTLGVGETVDLHKAKIVTLCKSGENDIHRILI